MARFKTVACEGTIESALQDGLSALVEVGEELTEWKENMSSNNMEHLPKYEELETACEPFERDGSDLGEALLKAIRTLAEGRAYQAPCPKHVKGTPCANCGWNGEPRAGFNNIRVHVLKPEDEGKCFGLMSSFKDAYAVIARGNCFTGVGSEEELQRELAKEEASFLPNERREVTLIEPNELIDAIPELKVAWREQTARRGLPRHARISNGVAAVSAALDELHANDWFDDGDDFDDVRGALEELTDWIEEVGNVDPPGMF